MMKIDKELVYKNRKALMAIFIVIGVFASVFYFKAFFQKGILYYGHFLKESTSTSSIPTREYFGSYEKGPISIKLTGLNQTDKLMELKAGNVVREYVYDNGTSADSMRLFDSSNFVIYSGTLAMELREFKEDGETAISYGNYQAKETNEFNEENPEPLLMVLTAERMNIVTRGNLNMLILVGILFVMLVIDVAFPTFFYKLKRFDFTSDTEISELHSRMQKISWSVTPFVLILILFKALK